MQDGSAFSADAWLWSFNQNLSVNFSGSLDALEVEDPMNPGTWQQPSFMLQVGNRQLLLFYPSGAQVAGVGWRVLNQPGCLSNALTVPESGTTT